MPPLSPYECRILGVLVEKAQTTPAQYPLTLNALVNGANQLSNREPVLHLNEDAVLEALDGLRAKGLVREVMLSGSRVPKYRHHAREVLEIETRELVVLAELLLRGPQTTGEIRSRASRMHPLESIEVVDASLQALAGRAEPLVRRLAPAPGTRAARYAQLLCPDLHPEDAPAASALGSTSIRGGSPGGGDPQIEERLSRLEQEVGQLRAAVDQIATALGVSGGSA
jgi:uncharacterized protein YceH (UPF0502 family)